MALIFHQFLTESLGDASYLIGDDSSHSAAVVDPQLDSARYLEAARANGLAIRCVVQTHVHEDFVSGVLALARLTGAEVCVSGHDAPAYGFPHRLVRDGDKLTFGQVVLSVRHAPGHTPEHIVLVAAKAGEEDQPFAVFTGGSLLVESAGRSDLLGPQRAEELARAQYRSLASLAALDDGVVVYPTHVHGSPCGAAIGDKPFTTIGYEKKHNALLREADEEAFVRAALADLPPKPRYYPRLKDINSRCPPPGGKTSAPALAPRDFEAASGEAGHRVLDTRQMLAFGGGHIAGAVNIGAGGHLAIWAGWMLEAEEALLLVLEADVRLEAVLSELGRTGFDRIAGYLAGGMSGWANAGLKLQSLRQLHVQELIERAAAIQIIDVRSPQEWAKGHVPGARHIFLPGLESALNSIDRAVPIAVYCDSGYRASIAASLLQARGFDAGNVAGSWQAWQARGLPVERVPIRSG